MAVSEAEPVGDVAEEVPLSEEVREDAANPSAAVDTVEGPADAEAGTDAAVAVAASPVEEDEREQQEPAVTESAQAEFDVAVSEAEPVGDTAEEVPLPASEETANPSATDHIVTDLADEQPAVVVNTSADEYEPTAEEASAEDPVVEQAE